MKKFYDIEIDSQIELENGKTLGKLEESKISVNDGNCSSGGWPADLPKPSVGGYGYTDGAIIELCNVEAISDMSDVGATIPLPKFEIINGKTYIVRGNFNPYWDDETESWMGLDDFYEYSVVAKDGEIGEFGSESIPFKITQYAGEKQCIFTNGDGGLNLKVSVALDERAVHKINEKYLPEGGFGYTEHGEQTIITWDGDTDGRDSFTLNFGLGEVPYYKVSEKSDNYTDSAVVGFNDFDEREAVKSDGNGAFMYWDGESILVVVADGGEFSLYNGVITGDAPSAGVYFMDFALAEVVVTSLTYGTPDTVHQIDEKYLPASGVVFWLKQDDSEYDDGYIRMYHDKECTRIVEIAEFNALLETRPLIWLRQPTGSNEAKLGVGYMPGVIDEDYAGGVRIYNGEVVWTAGEAD